MLRDNDEQQPDISLTLLPYGPAGTPLFSVFFPNEHVLVPSKESKLLQKAEN